MIVTSPLEARERSRGMEGQGHLAGGEHKAGSVLVVDRIARSSFCRRVNKNILRIVRGSRMLGARARRLRGCTRSPPTTRSTVTLYFGLCFAGMIRAVVRRLVWCLCQDY